MITVTILNMNGGRVLKEVLDALTSFEQVLICDSGSTDNSLQIAATFANVTIYNTPFDGFGKAHNHAAKLANYDWILSIDSDEVVSKELVEEIHALHLNPSTLYELPFHNYFNERWIKWCGWYPESHIRLYNRKNTSFTDAAVHEGVKSAGLKVVKLQHPVLHYSYSSISDFLVKMERYSTLFAQHYVGKKRASFLTALTHGAYAFFKSYVLQRGILGGVEGYLISRYNGETAFYKYLKLRELNNAHFAHVSSCRQRKTCELKKDSDRAL